MKTVTTILTLLVITILYGCDKDKFTTVPQVKIKDISPGDAFNGSVIRLETTFTDQEGDLDSVLVIYKWRNGDLVTRLFDTLRNSVGGLGLPPKLRSGEIFVEYAYGTVDPYKQLGGTPVAKDTSVTFGLVVKDKAGNRSDYVESKAIRFRKN